ncbi:MAG TPA: hypothetical protein VFC30_00175 [Solirubrobacteraceae bacterium]|nr:hypothetical protein [Solirubrobacteraceae bacterium]
MTRKLGDDMGLFGKRDKKAAEQEAASAEFERLSALSPQELAAELMPAFGPDGPDAEHGTPGLEIMNVLTWLLRDQPGAMTKYMPKLQQPVLAGIQSLVTAGLIVDGGRGKTNSTYWCATALGETTLNEGTVREYL